MTTANRHVHCVGTLARLATAWGRPSPDFLIIGTQKCGMTSLYQYLLRHPNVAPTNKRSIRFFDHGPNWAKGRRRDREPLPFEEALAREPEQLAADRERLLADPGLDPVHLRWHSYRGQYVEQLEAWLSRKLAAEPAEVMAGTHAFLGLPPLPLTDYPRFNRGAYEPLEPRLREPVSTHFVPPNRRLTDLLGCRPGWDA